MREEQQLARLQLEALPTLQFKAAATLGHNMKLSPARRYRFVHGLPLRGEPAHLLQFRPHPQQRRDGTQRITGGRRATVRTVLPIELIGIRISGREHKPFLLISTMCVTYTQREIYMHMQDSTI